MGILIKEQRKRIGKMDKTICSEYFCPQCRKYSGKAFTIIAEGESPPDSEFLKCQCGWTGKWIDCIERTK